VERGRGKADVMFHGRNIKAFPGSCNRWPYPEIGHGHLQS
jgi:hypothetical protein